MFGGDEVDNGNGGGMYNASSVEPTVTNCIFWGNDDAGDPDESAQIYGGDPTVNYCCIQGWTAGGLGGTGNIDDDPEFVGSGDNPLSLSTDSPCIDAGDGDEAPDADILGRGRYDHPVKTNTGAGDPDCVDMGAYEYSIVWFVDTDAGGQNNGLSWANAFTELQSALSNTAVVAGDEIWVADGTYYPDEGAGHTNGDRTESFELLANIAVYGGFEGGETACSARDWTANVTILSGDIDKDSTLDSDNSYNVVVGAAGATLDGFTITMGYADHASTAQYQCGGGMYNSGCSPTVTNCIFTDNEAYFGGGMFNDSASPTIKNCIFADNTARTANVGVGGAIYCFDDSDVVIENCTITQNVSDYVGGGIVANSYSDPQIKNSIVWDNDDSYGDDDVDAYNNSVVTVTYSAFEYYYEDGTSDVTWSYCVYTDPQFADAGNDDFHLKSAGGRWDPATSDWTDVGDDPTTSLCINTGDSSSCSNEPIPNGGVINMGAYGNTSKASKTGYGSLKVNLTPSAAQWRLVGSGTWNDSGDSIDLVSHGDTTSYGIEFKDHPGYETPSIMGGIHIYPEQETVRNVTYDPVIRYISPNGDDGDDGKSVAYAWRTIDYAIHGVDAMGGGTLYFDAQNGTYTDSLQASDFYDLNYMTNCWHYNGGVYISASKSVFPSQHISFTFMFSFDM